MNSISYELYFDYHSNKPYNNILGGEKYTTIKHKCGIVFVVDWCRHLTREDIIKSLNSVTCHICINSMKQISYYCYIHGALLGKEVTFDEKCNYCKMPI